MSDELKLFKESLPDEYDNTAIGIWVRDGHVAFQAGNGGDFGSSEWNLSPSDARMIARELIRCADAVAKRESE